MLLKDEKGVGCAGVSCGLEDVYKGEFYFRRKTTCEIKCGLVGSELCIRG